MEAQSLRRMPTGGLYWKTSFKVSSNHCTPVPNRIHSTCLYRKKPGWMDGWMASLLRPRTLLTYYPSSTQASEVFPQFYLNVSLISGVQIENQDDYVWENAHSKKTVSIKKITKELLKSKSFYYTFW